MLAAPCQNHRRALTTSENGTYLSEDIQYRPDNLVDGIDNPLDWLSEDIG